ncbi:MAG: hypothetical protein EA398_08485 [Deltaproteobacteria bacterium]|nr:MAG: hypothetical protein EA398_08485 [Deltaproteobacteria bacterium]
MNPPSADPPDRDSTRPGEHPPRPEHEAEGSARANATSATAADVDANSPPEAEVGADDACDTRAAEAAARAASKRAEALGRTGETIVEALGATARATGRVFGAVGSAAATAWRTVDPDLRRHILQLPLMGLTQLSPRDTLIERLPEDGHLPILFVHGLAGHPGNFGPMRAYFRVMGRARTFSLGFPPGQDFDLMARRLAEAVRQIVDIHDLGPHQRVQIVAHSMGGIVTRLALLDHDIGDRIARIITLGTPHAGTHAARFAATMQTLELRPGSALLGRLDAQRPWSGPPLTAFWSPADMLILPADHATLPGTSDVRLDGFTHYSWLIDPRVWQAAWEILERDRPAPTDLRP